MILLTHPIKFFPKKFDWSRLNSIALPLQSLHPHRRCFPNAPESNRRVLSSIDGPPAANAARARIPLFRPCSAPAPRTTGHDHRHLRPSPSQRVSSVRGRFPTKIEALSAPIGSALIETQEDPVFAAPNHRGWPPPRRRCNFEPDFISTVGGPSDLARTWLESSGRWPSSPSPSRRPAGQRSGSSSRVLGMKTVENPPSSASPFFISSGAVTSAKGHEDAFLGFVEYARSMLSSSDADENSDADVGSSGHAPTPPWSWVVSRILRRRLRQRRHSCYSPLRSFPGDVDSVVLVPG